MDYKRIADKLDKAIKSKVKSQALLDEIVGYIAKEKGFKNHKLFNCNWASGSDTVVTFNFECEMSDMDLEYMVYNTREDIIQRLSKYKDNVSEETIKLLNE